MMPLSVADHITQREPLHMVAQYGAPMDLRRSSHSLKGEAETQRLAGRIEAFVPAVPAAMTRGPGQTKL
jgi:hypothetical protein